MKTQFKKPENRRIIWLFPILFSLPLATTVAASAQGKDLSDAGVAKILVQCSSVFEQNSLVSTVLRFLGWMIMKLLVELASACESLFNNCFKFVDFTSYSKVQEYIDKFQVVWVALVCLSILFLGIILILWQEKKPKFVVNLLIAVLVVSSSGFLIDKMNGLLSSSVRNELMGGRGTTAAHSVVGNNVRDLVYLEAKVGIANLYDKNEDGIRNYKTGYENLSKKQFELMNINETLDPDSASGDLKKVLSVRPMYVSKDLGNMQGTDFLKVGGDYYYLQDVYDGVAWTNLLNEHYYRYTVEWLPAYLELLSLVIVYLFMSYKVIRSVYEIVINHILAYLYSANLSGGKKILKILDSIKDLYIVVIFIIICVKVYQIATHFVPTMDLNGLSKGLILLFLAFALLDGPNMVQKLTGIDAGMSDGMGKMMGMFYGSQMISSIVRTAGGLLMKPFTIGNGSYRSGGGHRPPVGSGTGGNYPNPPDGSGTGGNDPNPPDGSGTGGNDPNPPDGSGNDPDSSGGSGAGGNARRDFLMQYLRNNQDPNAAAIGNSQDTVGGNSEGNASNADGGIPDPNKSEVGSVPDGNGNIPDEKMTDTDQSHVSGKEVSSGNSQDSGIVFLPSDPSVSSDRTSEMTPSAASGQEEVLNGMDPATGSMAETAVSSMESMEQDLRNSGSQGMSGNNSNFQPVSQTRHVGTMFSPDRHSGGTQEIPHSDLPSSSASKAESQVERNMAFDNKDDGGGKS